MDQSSTLQQTAQHVVAQLIYQSRLEERNHILFLLHHMARVYGWTEGMSIRTAIDEIHKQPLEYPSTQLGLSQ